MYQQVAHYKKQEIRTASPGKLIVMLYDGAIKQIDIAKDAYEAQDYEGKVQAISRCRDIILELIGALDFEKGGKIAETLQALYVYILNRLKAADMERNHQALIESRTILVDLRGAWDSIVKNRETAQVLTQTG
ncbi:MAG TPA: flagellar export chaperone FliS [bacterium]|nr:flagellar export chaperone FliS [bacterium]